MPGPIAAAATPLYGGRTDAGMRRLGCASTIASKPASRSPLTSHGRELSISESPITMTRRHPAGGGNVSAAWNIAPRSARSTTAADSSAPATANAAAPANAIAAATAIGTDARTRRDRLERGAARTTTPAA